MRATPGAGRTDEKRGPAHSEGPQAKVQPLSSLCFLSGFGLNLCQIVFRNLLFVEEAIKQLSRPCWKRMSPTKASMTSQTSRIVV
jgi:hypothetical protein